MGFSFFLAAGLEIASLPLAPHRHKMAKAVAASLVTYFVTFPPQLLFILRGKPETSHPGHFPGLERCS
jgi:hypothetical protein